MRYYQATKADAHRSDHSRTSTRALVSTGESDWPQRLTTATPSMNINPALRVEPTHDFSNQSEAPFIFPRGASDAPGPGSTDALTKGEYAGNGRVLVTF